MRRVFSFFLLFSIWLTACRADELVWKSAKEGFSVAITLSSASISIIDPLIVTLDFHYPVGYRPSLDALRMNLLKFGGVGLAPFSLISEKTKPPKETPSGITQRIRYELEPMLSGKHYLTFREITFEPIGKGRDPVQLISDIFAIDVALPMKLGQLNFTAPLMPLAPGLPVEIDGQNRHAILDNPLIEEEEIKRNQELMQEKGFPWIGVAFAFMAGLIYFIANTRPVKAPLPKEPLKLTKKRVQEKALSAIDRLSVQERGDFFTKLLKIVRNFTEERYQLKASTYTTQEFLEKASTHPMLGEQAQKSLSEFLNRSDRVKFANYEPTAEDMEKATEATKEFIQL